MEAMVERSLSNASGANGMSEAELPNALVCPACASLMPGTVVSACTHCGVRVRLAYSGTAASGFRLAVRAALVAAGVLAGIEAWSMGVTAWDIGRLAYSMSEEQGWRTASTILEELWWVPLIAIVSGVSLLIALWALVRTRSHEEVRIVRCGWTAAILLAVHAVMTMIGTTMWYLTTDFYMLWGG